ncbi:MAG: NADH:ubiquinone reductase (Na(+)-transporting) subunit B [Actinobacteria bacterium]|nr:NADH:ubiquinone reductase (Na(+)-transporting) subunit B [Actinomycetota bacterium]
MKFLNRIFESIEPQFLKEGKYAKYYPLFEGFYSLCFSPKDVTKSKVHVRDALDTKRFMTIVIISLLPCLLFGIFNTGYQAHLAAGRSLDLVPVLLTGLIEVLPLVIISYSVGLFWEFLSAVIRGHEINEGFLVTGMLYPLVLPSTIPLWQAAVGITFGVIVGKEVFGGSGRNFLNPALTARAFLFFSYPSYMSGDVWTSLLVSKDQLVDGFSGASALAIAAATQAPQSALVALQDAGYTLQNLVLGLVPGSIGETSVLCVALGALILLVTGVGSWRTMLGCVIGAVATVSLFQFFATDQTIPFLNLPLSWQLSMGSFAFAIVFMATDPVSSPSLNSSRFIYGILIGCLGMLIRVINPAYPEGWMLAILLMNVFAPLIDHVVYQRGLKRRVPNVI